jgi:TRAP-type C4-dicarboxylate transport system permease small subunit
MVSPPPESSRAGVRTDHETAEADPSEVFRIAARHFKEARDFGLFYLRTRLDRVALSVRNLFGLIAVLLTGLLMGAALLVTAVVLLARGIAETLTTLFDGRVWLGDLLTAVLLLALLVGAGLMAIKHVENLWKQRTMRVYERLKRRQRATHGTDVDHRANP